MKNINDAEIYKKSITHYMKGDGLNDPNSKNLHVIVNALNLSIYDKYFCGAIPASDDYLIDKNGFVFVRVDVLQQRGVLDSCLYEELFELMGLPRDDDSLLSSMFTDSYKLYKFPTNLDRMMLKLLYNLRIKHGMAEDEVRPILQEILKTERLYGQ